MKTLFSSLRTTRTREATEHTQPPESPDGAPAAETDLASETFESEAAPEISHTVETSEMGNITVSYAHASPSPQNDSPLELLLSSAFQTSPLPMALVAPHGQWLLINPAICAYLGYPPRQLCDLSLTDLAHQGDVGILERSLESIEIGAADDFALEIRLFSRNGDELPTKIFASAARERDRSTKFLLVQLAEIGATENSALSPDQQELLFENRIASLESELEKLARHNEILTQQLADQFEEPAFDPRKNVVDPLTGAYSLAHLERMLESEVARCSRSNAHFSLVLCDIDYFTRIKTGCGNQNAERVVLHAAQIFEARLRRADVLFRTDEDEFAVLLPNTAICGASVLATSLRKRLGENLVEDVGLCSASFGVAQWSGHENGAFLLERARAALQSAKNEGRNRIAIADD